MVQNCNISGSNDLQNCSSCGVYGVLCSQKYDQKWSKKGTAIKWLKAKHLGSKDDPRWSISVDKLLGCG